MIRRREFLIGSLMAAPMLGTLPSLAQEREDKVREALFALDRKHGGRLGVAILDSGNNRIVAHRGEERFAMCSTFKFVAAAFACWRGSTAAKRSSNAASATARPISSPIHR
jgi:beta-lactamase class A